jgi:hypothetical protein
MERIAIAVVSILVAAALVFGASVLAFFLGSYSMAHQEVARFMPFAGIGVLVIAAPTIARKLHSARE